MGFISHAVMAREAVERDSQHHLAGRRRGQPRSFSTVSKPLRIAADVGQARQIGTHGVACARQTAARVEGDFGNLRACLASVAVRANRRLPIGRDPLKQFR
jgi:hypothetical protein